MSTDSSYSTFLLSPTPSFPSLSLIPMIHIKSETWISSLTLCVSSLHTQSIIKSYWFCLRWTLNLPVNSPHFHCHFIKPNYHPTANTVALKSRFYNRARVIILKYDYVTLLPKSLQWFFYTAISIKPKLLNMVYKQLVFYPVIQITLFHLN